MVIVMGKIILSSARFDLTMVSFPRVLGSGGRGQSHHSKIFIRAKRLRLCFV